MGDIVVTDGVIAAVARKAEAAYDLVLEGKGRWVIPSWIDCHVHLGMNGRSHLPSGLGTNSSSPEIALGHGARNCIEAVLSGVCLARDVGCKDDTSRRLKHFVDAGLLLGPEIVLSRAPLCQRGGHGSDFRQCLPSEAAIQGTLERHAKSGCGSITIMNRPELFPERVLEQISETAHALGLRVAVHAFTTIGIAGALLAGADSIEHALVYDAATAAAARDRRTCFVPTRYCSISSLREGSVHTVSATEVQYLRQWETFLSTHMPFHIEERLPIVAGSDAGSAPRTVSDIPFEIISLTQSGLTPIDAIRAGTIRAAEMLARSDRYGSLQPGQWASVLVLRKTPLEDIAAILDVESVWLRGCRVRHAPPL